MSTAFAVVALIALLCAVVTAAWGTVALSYWWELHHRRDPVEPPAPKLSATALRPPQRTA